MRKNFTSVRQYAIKRKEFDLLLEELETEAGVKRICEMDILKFFDLLVEGVKCGSSTLVQLLIKIRSDHIKQLRRKR